MPDRKGCGCCGIHGGLRGRNITGKHCRYCPIAVAQLGSRWLASKEITNESSDNRHACGNGKRARPPSNTFLNADAQCIGVAAFSVLLQYSPEMRWSFKIQVPGEKPSCSSERSSQEIHLPLSPAHAPQHAAAMSGASATEKVRYYNGRKGGSV